MKLFASLFAATAIAWVAPPVSAAKLDAGIFTLYAVSTDGTLVTYLVCGRVPQTEGCFGSGSLGSLDRACAVMEGKPHQKGNVVTRNIYVFDKRSSAADPALLNVYVRKDKITDTSDTIRITLAEQIQTGNAGAPDANCFMAGSDSLIFVGADASQVASKIVASDLKVSQIYGETKVQSITADQRGLSQ